MLDRNAFLSAKAMVPTEEVHLPELGGSVIVRGMTAKSRTAFEKQFQLSNGKPNKTKIAEIRERLVVACVCGEDGNTLFTEADIPSIGEMPASVIERLVGVSQKLCGMTQQDVEVLSKNSDGTSGDC